MKYLAHTFLIFTAATVLVHQADAQTLPLSRDWVEQIESVVDLDDAVGSPAETGGSVPHEIENYARFYRMTKIEGRTVVEAVFIMPRSPIRTLNGHARTPSSEETRFSNPGIYLDELLPVIDDGGCSVVSLSFDYDSRRLLSARCNDLA